MCPFPYFSKPESDCEQREKNAPPVDFEVSLNPLCSPVVSCTPCKTLLGPLTLPILPISFVLLEFDEEPSCFALTFLAPPTPPDRAVGSLNSSLCCDALGVASEVSWG